MPAGLNLGGAFFTIYGDNEQVLRSMAQARAATETATKAMATAQKMYADAAKSTNAGIISMNVQAAESQVRTAMVAANAVKANVAVLEAYGLKIAASAKATQAATGATNAQSNAQRNLANNVKNTNSQLTLFNANLGKIGATLATLTGFGAIASGALLVRESLLGVIDASQKLNQEQFRLRETFGGLAPMYEAQAQALAKLAGKPLSDAIAATNEFATVERNYGLSTAQVLDVQARAADAAAQKGVSLEEAAKRIAPALRGEAESIEYLGYSLQSNYLKALQDVNSQEYKNWQLMGVREKTQRILLEFQNQNNEYTGAAARRAEEAAGAIDKMSAALERAQATLGQKMNPQLVAFATFVDETLPKVTAWLEWMINLYDVGQKMAAQLGVPPWLGLIMAPEFAAATLIAGQLSQHVQDIIEMNALMTKPLFGPSVAELNEAIKRGDEAAIKDRKEAQDKLVKQLETLKKLAIDKEIEAENGMYQAKKDAYQADKEAQIEAANDKKDTALAGIRDQKQASEDAYEAELIRLTKLKDAELAAADERHRGVQAAMAAEKDAASEASEAQQRRIKEQAETDIEASQQRLRDIKTTLEAEDRVRDAARLSEDRDLEDRTERLKRELEDRHEAVMEGIAEEAEAVRDGYEREDRRLDQRGKKIDDGHRKALRAIEEREQAAEKAHDAALRAIEIEGDAAQKSHEGLVRQIEVEKDAADDRHALVVRDLGQEQDAAEARHKAVVRSLEQEKDAAEARNKTVVDGLKDEQDAADDRHRAAVRAIDGEGEAAQTVHDTLTRSLEDRAAAADRLHHDTTEALEDELDLAKSIHEQALDEIEARNRAEDDRHRAVTDNQEAELRAQLASLDATLDGLNKEADAQARALKLADLKDDLLRAQSSGNAGTIAEAERAIQKVTLDEQRDAAVDLLKAKRDALVAAGKLARDAADEEHRQIEEGLKLERAAADERLDLIQKSVDARKDAADDDLYRLKQVVEARKQAADDELARIQRGLDVRQTAADDELDLITRSVETRREAADDELDLIQASVDARKQAADDALDLVKEGAAVRKQAADDELARIRDLLDARKLQADDDFALTKESLAVRKQALEDEKVKRQEVADDEKTKADDKERRDTVALEKRKLQIQDERDESLKALEVKRAQEEDDHQEAGRRNEDALTEEKRRIADRRTTEDLAAQDKRTEAEETARVEQELIRDTSQLQVQASKDALDQYNREWTQRKATQDTLAREEIAHIHAVYDDPATGLLPRLKQAFEDTKENYDKRTIEVNAQYDNERKQIAATFDHPQNGLFAKLEAIHNRTVEGLKDTKKDWEENFQKPIEAVTATTLTNVENAFKAAFDRIGKNNKLDLEAAEVEDRKKNAGGRQGGPGGDGPGPVPGGIPSPWRVTFPYDAPYNGPFPGGAMWSGGPARHQGVDLALPGPNNGMGKPYGAFQSGQVYWQGYEPAGGNGMIIRTDEGLYNYYGHSQRFLVGQGDRVEAGQQIGILGESGTEGSPHLHYAVRTSVNGGHVDPVPYLTGGGSGVGEGGEDRDLGQGVSIKDGYLTFTLFGRQFRYKLPAGGGAGIAGSALLEAIEQLGARIGGREFGRAAAAIADSEGATGDLDRKGAGGARGPFQFDPGGELRHYADFLGTSMEEAGTRAGRYPLEAARYALSGGKGGAGFSGEGYLGRALQSGIKARLEGPDLAEYASRVGQRPADDLWKRAGESYRKLYGYRNGGFIPEPTLLVGQSLGPYAVAGEAAPEWVTPHAPGTGAGTRTTVEMPVYLGNREIERLWIDGYKLNVQRGRTPGGIVA